MNVYEFIDDWLKKQHMTMDDSFSKSDLAQLLQDAYAYKSKESKKEIDRLRATLEEISREDVGQYCRKVAEKALKGETQ